ncbi:YegS/Rv2252/BmrU family lipid kinase [Nocardioides thalensis]|uniref:YegS/Rv2252/BmrU family lipid kinase n=1 Tax=Nocardioides thalensis TaxID=1914755 RepID=A0A853C9W9_9ACTN|nr:diacylglycerol kinase family protein [Nocardioides thalensis]NYJ03013.1 YegS/Rv2252/BmrU family lipid kinase [Nocardioides thalensis]
MVVPRRLLVITNADAGTADEAARDEALDVLRAGADVTVAATSSPDELDDVLTNLEDRTVVVVGGDGSLHAVVAALHRQRTLTTTVLGLVPLGTGNDFARALDIPLEPAAAARVVLTGPDRPLDLIVDEHDDITVNSVHAGAGAAAGERGARWKERLGAIGVGRVNLGKLGYPIGALQTALNPRGLRVRVEVDGTVVSDVDTEILMVVVGNGTSVGGGAELTPEARTGDGLLDVVVAKPAGVADRLALALRVPFGTHQDHRTVEALRGRSVTVTGGPFRCNSDGEIGGPVRSRTWEVRPAAYRMIVPAGQESESGHPAH